MPSSSSNTWPHYWRQLQLLTSNVSEGVIVIDVHQTIRWANSAALAMHGVDCYEALGRTIDEYHANFQVKFRNTRPAATQEPIESVARGQACRDVIVEVTPLRGETPQWVHSVRNIVLVDDAGDPSCIVLVLRPLAGEPSGASEFVMGLGSVPNAAAIILLSDHTIVDTNDAFARLAGRERHTVIGRPLEACCLFDSDDKTDQLQSSLASGEAMSIANVTLRSSRGAALQVHLSAQPVMYGTQRCMLLNVIENPVGQYQAEAQDPARAQALALCSVAPAPLYVLDTDMRILAVSQAWVEWLGYSSDAVIGRRIVELMPTSSASHFRDQTWGNLQQAGTVRDIACQFIRNTGQTIDASISARMTLDKFGNPACVVVAPVDMTEQKRTEMRFTKLFTLSPLPMVVRRLDDARILDVNDAFLTAIGHPVESVIGRSLDDLGIFESKQQRQQFEQTLRTTGRVQNMDIRIKSSAGDLLDCLASAEQVYVFGHHCAVLMLQDVTDRRRNEIQLFQAIETVMRDTSWFSRSVIEKLAILRSPPRMGARSAELDDLTPREREVLGLISHGLSDTDIAQKLGLTRSTVRNHVATLYSKIDVHSRSSAIIWARERGVNIAWPPSGSPSFMRRAPPQRKAGDANIGPKDQRI